MSHDWCIARFKHFGPTDFNTIFWYLVDEMQKHIIEHVWKDFTPELEMLFCKEVSQLPVEDIEFCGNDLGSGTIKAEFIKKLKQYCLETKRE